MTTKTKGFATLTSIAIIICIIVISGGAYVVGKKSAEKEKNVDPIDTVITVDKPSTSVPKVPSTSKPTPTPIPVPENYVQLMSGGGPENPHKATFKFLTDINPNDLKGSNLYFCVLSASAGTPPNEVNSNCNKLTTPSLWSSVTEISSENDYIVKYDPSTRILTVSDIETNSENGSFYVGCASCTSNIRFTGIHTSNGALLPDKILTVY